MIDTPGRDDAAGRPDIATVRLAVAEDDDLVRAGILAILQVDPALTVVAEAPTGREALNVARRHRLDIMLLDIRMPDLNGLQALRQLRHEHPQLPIAMLTTFTDEAYIAEAVGLGALGFLLKSDSPRDLITAIKAIASGGAAFSPRVARWLVRAEATARIRRGNSARETIAGLTPRQRTLLATLSTGASNAEIGRQLHLTSDTVKQYLRALFDRLEVTNRVQAAIIGLEAGLLDEQIDTPPPDR